tara:strand:- start:26865 stop:27137 length:273 start_codon:yes stop_codon:yes gene_type:complete
MSNIKRTSLNSPVRLVQAAVDAPERSDYCSPDGWWESSNHTRSALVLGLVTRGYIEIRRHPASNAPIAIRATERGRTFAGRRQERFEESN